MAISWLPQPRLCSATLVAVQRRPFRLLRTVGLLLLFVMRPLAPAAQSSPPDAALLRLVPPGADMLVEISPPALDGGTLLSTLLPMLIGQPALWSHPDASAVETLAVSLRLFPVPNLEIAAARGSFAASGSPGRLPTLFARPGRVTADLVPFGFDGTSWTVVVSGAPALVSAAQLRAAVGALPVELVRPLADSLPPAAGRLALIVPAPAASTLGLPGFAADFGFLAGVHVVGRFGPRPASWLDVAAQFPGMQAAVEAERVLPDAIRHFDRGSRPLVRAERFGRRLHISVRGSELLASLVGAAR